MNRRDFLKLAGIGMGSTLLPSELALASTRGDPTHHIAMLYDTTKCIGCRACQIACREWNETTVEKSSDGLYDAPLELSADTWTTINLYRDADEWAFIKYGCMHCIEPACASACPVSALQKQENGAVTYNPKRCIGCRYCMVACPFHIPRAEWEDAIQVIAKCTLCHDRLINGDGPACAEACPAGALIWGERGELVAEAESRLAEHPDRYVNYIYGKEDAGGTSVLYLSHVPFEKLGLPPLQHEGYPELSENTGKIVIPSALVAAPVVLAAIKFMAGRGSKEG